MYGTEDGRIPEDIPYSGLEVGSRPTGARCFASRIYIDAICRHPASVKHALETDTIDRSVRHAAVREGLKTSEENRNAIYMEKRQQKGTLRTAHQVCQTYLLKRCTRRSIYGSVTAEAAPLVTDSSRRTYCPSAQGVAHKRRNIPVITTSRPTTLTKPPVTSWGNNNTQVPCEKGTRLWS